MKQLKVYPKATCPTCNTEFDLKRKDTQYCSPNCRKKSFRKSTGRKFEYHLRNRDHYERSAWLTYDVYRMPEPNRSTMIQKLLEAASHEPANKKDGDAKIRSILLDPFLLGAVKYDSRGRFRHDTKIGVSNIAKQVYQYCMINYGCGTKDCILDGGKPAKRFFLGDPIVELPSYIERSEPNNKHMSTLKSLTGLSRQAYHGMLVAEFEEKLSEVKLAA